jgi:hypothetical protein
MEPEEIKDRPKNKDESSHATFIVPVKHPVDRSEVEHLFLRGDLTYGATATRNRQGGGDEIVSYQNRVADTSAITIFSAGDTVDETLENIARQSDLGPDDDLVKVAECAAFWKSVGADTLIYVCSLGASVVANGLVIRFAGFDALYSTLLIVGGGSLAYNNAQIVFTSLINPPKDNIPEAGKTQYGLINKFALLPVSFVFKAGVTGSILSAIGDTNFGTQQAVSAGTSPLIGPIMTGLRMGIRKCYHGSYVLAPETPGPGEALRKAYSTDPNRADSNRSYRYGSVRDMFGKLFAGTAGTLLLSYSGGFKIDSYCHQIGNQTIEPWNSTLPQNSVFPDNCVGGNFVFMFRELGISFGYAVGLLIVEPAIAAVTNRIYDYFYSPASDDEGVNLEEIEEDKSTGEI